MIDDFQAMLKLLDRQAAGKAGTAITVSRGRYASQPKIRASVTDGGDYGN